MPEISPSAGVVWPLVFVGAPIRDPGYKVGQALTVPTGVAISESVKVSEVTPDGAVRATLQDGRHLIGRLRQVLLENGESAPFLVWELIE